MNQLDEKIKKLKRNIKYLERKERRLDRHV